VNDVRASLQLLKKKPRGGRGGVSSASTNDAPPTESDLDSDVSSMPQKMSNVKVVTVDLSSQNIDISYKSNNNIQNNTFPIPPTKQIASREPPPLPSQQSIKKSSVPARNNKSSYQECIRASGCQCPQCAIPIEALEIVDEYDEQDNDDKPPPDPTRETELMLSRKRHNEQKLKALGVTKKPVDKNKPSKYVVYITFEYLLLHCANYFIM
jgi:hypothetical protein